MAARPGALSNESVPQIASARSLKGGERDGHELVRAGVAAALIDLRCGFMPAPGEFGFPGSRKGAFAVAPMLGELEKAMVSGQAENH